MDKAKRYMGLVAAIALLVLAFTPISLGLFSFRATPRLTPLDSTVLTQLTFPLSKDMSAWTVVRDHFNSCPPFQETASRGVDCDAAEYMFVLREHARELSALEPTLPELMSEYYVGRPDAYDLVQERHFAYRGTAVRRSPRVLEIEWQLGKSMAKYLDAKRPGITMRIYATHALLLLVVALMVYGRQQVGAVLLWPFSFAFGLVRTGARAAKSVHDKV